MSNFSKPFFHLLDLAGAIAELELIESLKTLPDNYYVISDVKLEINKAIISMVIG